MLASKGNSGAVPLLPMPCGREFLLIKELAIGNVGEATCIKVPAGYMCDALACPSFAEHWLSVDRGRFALMGIRLNWLARSRQVHWIDAANWLMDRLTELVGCAPVLSWRRPLSWFRYRRWLRDQETLTRLERWLLLTPFQNDPRDPMGFCPHTNCAVRPLCVRRQAIAKTGGMLPVDEWFAEWVSEPR
jgi:hypothetical protein